MQGTSAKKAQVPKSAQRNYAGVTSLVCNTKLPTLAVCFGSTHMLKVESSFDIGTNCMQSSISM